MRNGAGIARHPQKPFSFNSWDKRSGVLVLQYDFDQLVEQVVLLEQCLSLMKERTMKTEVLEKSEELLTVHEVAEYLRVDDTTVRRWIKAGAMVAVVLPHNGKRVGYRVKKQTLDALLGKALPA
jgi:excisionase family DNA binding protein